MTCKRLHATIRVRYLLKWANRRFTLLLGLLSLASATCSFAATPDLAFVRLAVSTLLYDPTIPSEVPQEWKAWEASTNDLIVAVAGSAKRTASAADIWYEARRAGIDVNTVYVLVEMLSRFDAHKVSKPTRIGLLQLVPAVHEAVGNPENSLFQPKYNLRVGCSLLRAFLDASHGNLDSALAGFLRYASPQPDVRARLEEFGRLSSARSAQLNKSKPASTPEK